MRSNIYGRGTMRAALIIAVATACAAQNNTRPVAAAPPAEYEAPESQPVGVVRHTHAHPTGDRSTSTVLVEKTVPRQVALGERYNYTIRVTNLTNMRLTGVIVREREEEQRAGRWVIGTLEPGASKTIQGTAVATRVGQRASCLSVDVRPAPPRPMCTAINVVNPQLRITKVSTPQAAYTCERPSFTYRVTNTGTGIARRVVIREPLPSGMTTMDGRREIMIPAGDLAAGATRTFTVGVRAERPGSFDSRATASSETAEAMSNRTRLRIVEPELRVEIDGPEWQYAGEPVTYRIRVTNDSEIPARDTMLMLDANQPLPPDADSRSLGTLMPGQSRTTSVTLPSTGNLIELQASARSSCAQVADRVSTGVRRVPALRVETVDTRDPVPVGDTTTYEIAVTNQGQAPAANVEVTAQLSPNMTIVNVRGQTEGTVDGDSLDLGRIESLPPGATARWSIEARADEPGDTRFRTEVDSGFIGRPVPDVEPTQVIEPQS